MPRILRQLLFLSLVLSACSPTGLTPESLPPTRASDAPTAVITHPAVTEVSPSYPQGCGYQWAYKNMPELSSAFQKSVQQLQPAAKAMAFGFGEDCTHADGSVTFIPMETDFNITFESDDLSDETAGEWVVKIMQIIEAIPPDQIMGPRPGRVSVLLESNGEQKRAIFYIDQYHALLPGLSNAEVFQALQTQP